MSEEIVVHAASVGWDEFEKINLKKTDLISLLQKNDFRNWRTKKMIERMLDFLPETVPHSALEFIIDQLFIDHMKSNLVSHWDDEFVTGAWSGVDFQKRKVFGQAGTKNESFQIELDF